MLDGISYSNGEERTITLTIENKGQDDLGNK